MTTNFSDPHSRFYYDADAFLPHTPEICSPCRTCPNAENIKPCKGCKAPMAYDLFLCGELDYVDIPKPKKFVKQVKKKPLFRTINKMSWNEIAERHGFKNPFDMFSYFRIKREMGFREMAKCLGRAYNAVRLETIRLDI